MTFRLRPAAEADLEAIVFYIARRNPQAAWRWHDTVQECCKQLGEMPGLGTPRDDVRPGLRLFPIGNYLTLYEVKQGVAEMIRVLHSARLWQELI